jgi:hypothetical protein
MVVITVMCTWKVSDVMLWGGVTPKDILLLAFCVLGFMANGTSPPALVIPPV